VHQIHLALLDGELTAAPVNDDIGRILDVGTGTGEWAIAMAEKYPHAEVIGTDLSAIQPDQVPENLFFEIDDAEQEWTYTQGFDLIHMRNLSGSFKNWNFIYEQAFKHLKPGGYLEVRDIQSNQWMTEVPDSPSAKFARVLKSASDKAGRPLGVSHIKRNKARQAGFVDVQLGYLALPLGTWPQDPKENWIGKMWLIGVLEGLEATALRLFTTQKDWTPEDVRELCSQVEEQLTSSTSGSFSQV
jgi:SAM-dependent methyltransferase